MGKTSIGVDYSRNPKNWDTFCATLKSRGYTFVGRYLPWDLAYAPRDKRALTIPECEAMTRHGIRIFAWWENSPDHIGAHTERRAWDGYVAGAEDARRARYMMEYFGQSSKPIYFCVDVDTTAARVTPYFEGVCSVLPVAQVGVYGGYAVVHGLRKSGLADYACQTEAWKYNYGWSPYAQLRQWTVHGPGVINGVGCDGLDAYAEDFGQWMYGKKGLTMADIEKIMAKLEAMQADIDKSQVAQSFRMNVALAKDFGTEAEAKVEIAKALAAGVKLPDFMEK